MKIVMPDVKVLLGDQNPTIVALPRFNPQNTNSTGLRVSGMQFILQRTSLYIVRGLRPIGFRVIPG